MELPQIEAMDALSLLPLTRYYTESGNAYSDYPFTAFKPKENNLTSTQTENGHVNNRGHEADVREIQGKTLLLGNGPSPDICSVGKNTSTHVWYRTISNGTVRGAPAGSGTDKPGVPKVGTEVGKPSAHNEWMQHRKSQHTSTTPGKGNGCQSRRGESSVYSFLD